MEGLKAFSQALRKRRGLLIIIVAALLIELISAAQYYYTYRLLEKELERRAESELTMKAILIKSTLNAAEDALTNHIWDIRRCLWNADSVGRAVRRMVSTSRYLLGASMSFVPYFYPEKGRLYEPYVLKKDGEIVMSQIGSENHDYTKRDFYQKAMGAKEALWVDPYVDNEGAHAMITSYVTVVRTSATAASPEPKVAGVAGVDVSLKWLSDTIGRRHVYPSSFNLLLTESGVPIARPTGSNAGENERVIDSDYFVALINDSTVSRYQSRSGRSTIIPFKKDGEKGSIFYANMKGKPHWQIAVVCYNKEVYGALASLRVHLLLLMLVASAILFLLLRSLIGKERELSRKSQEESEKRKELHIASNIQHAMIATNDPNLAATNDVSVWGQLIPAKEVGGDLYNAFIRDGKLFFCIGDVSGKGVPSALIMAVTQALFRNIATRENNPAHIMAQLNETACRNNKSNYFATLFVGVLDLPSGHLRFCNAGHEVPILLTQSGEKAECRMLEVEPHLPIGLFDDFRYEMQEIVMQKDASLFLYTDGLTEGRSPKNEPFGMERLMQVLADGRSIDAQQLVENMVKRYSDFIGTAPQRDDLTLLALHYSPVEENCLLDEEFVLQNDISQVTQLGAMIKETAQRLNIPKSLAYQLRLAMEEAVVNIIDYAYPAGTSGDIRVRETFNGQRLKFVITDTGIAFNPTEASIADTSLSAEDRPVGGLGILLVRKLMDAINYERIDGKNILTLTKTINVKQ